MKGTLVRACAALGIVLTLVLASSASAIDAGKVEAKLKSKPLSPAPLFPTRLPASITCCQAAIYTSKGNFNVTWHDHRAILAGYGRGNKDLLPDLLHDLKKKGDKVLRVTIGDQKAIFAKSKATIFYLWRAQGRTYYAVNGVHNDGADRKDLRTLVATSAPLR